MSKTPSSARARARIATAGLLAALAFSSRGALAVEPTTAGSSDAADSKALTWRADWPRFRKAEIALTAGMTLQAGAAMMLYPKNVRTWEGGVLFDEAAWGALRLDTRRGREAADRYSDYLYWASIAYPWVDVAVAGTLRGSSDVALQMTAMNLETFAFVGAVAITAENLGRVRPSDRGCREDPHYSADCGNEAVLTKSLLSGHSTVAFASAGLTCAHHQYLELYGGGAPDIFACAAALVAASAVGTLRVLSDNHYATDVLGGAVVGLFGGYGLPVLLHYGHGGDGGGHARSVLPSFSRGRGSASVSAVLAPEVSRTGLGVTIRGVF